MVYLYLIGTGICIGAVAAMTLGFGLLAFLLLGLRVLIVLVGVSVVLTWGLFGKSFYPTVPLQSAVSLKPTGVSAGLHHSMALFRYDR